VENVEEGVLESFARGIATNVGPSPASFQRKEERRSQLGLEWRQSIDVVFSPRYRVEV
jgi:hypothetical protein